MPQFVMHGDEKCHIIRVQIGQSEITSCDLLLFFKQNFMERIMHVVSENLIKRMFAKGVFCSNERDKI